MAISWGYNNKADVPKTPAVVTCEKNSNTFTFMIDDSEILFNPYYMELTVK